MSEIIPDAETYQQVVDGIHKEYTEKLDATLSGYFDDQHTQALAAFETFPNGRAGASIPADLDFWGAGHGWVEFLDGKIVDMAYTDSLVDDEGLDDQNIFPWGGGWAETGDWVCIRATGRIRMTVNFGGWKACIRERSDDVMDARNYRMESAAAIPWLDMYPSDEWMYWRSRNTGRISCAARPPEGGEDI